MTPPDAGTGDLQTRAGDGLARLGVVIPTIGDRPEIRRLLESILDQTRPVQAVCVVVDAVDTSLVEGIVADLEPRLAGVSVEVVSTGAQRGEGEYLAETGYGVAVNTGLKALDADLLSFLDDDDEILPAHYAQLEAALDPGRGKGVAYCRVLVVSTDGRRRYFQDGPLPSGRFSPFVLIGSHPVLLPATLIHRSVLDQVGGLDEDFDRKADTDMLVRLGQATEFAAVSDATYVYYRNPHGSAVHDRALTEMAGLIRKHQDRMTRRERLVSWDSLVRSSLRTDMHALARESASEATGAIWPRRPDFVTGGYLRLRGMELPGRIRRLAKGAISKARTIASSRKDI